MKRNCIARPPVIFCIIVIFAFLIIRLAVLNPQVMEAYPGVNAQAANTRPFSEQYQKGLTLSGSCYSFLNTHGTFSRQDYYGASVKDILENELGLTGEDTESIKIAAHDGFSRNRTVAELKDVNPEGLHSLFAWQAGEPNAASQNPPLPVLDGWSDGGNGPFRFIWPQTVVGGGGVGTVNNREAIRNFVLLEISPLPAGMDPLTNDQIAEIPEGTVMTSSALSGARWLLRDKERASINRLGL